ncbi:MAG: hypothetical protein ACRDID_06915, partial [Ktedonobacterales bacterium]
IDLGSTSATLQANQRAALIQLASEQLLKQAVTATIAPGDRYLDDSGHVVVASAPLQFHLTFALGEAPGDYLAPCAHAQFCSVPIYTSAFRPPGGGWLAQVSVVAAWAINDTSGRRLTSANYLAGQSSGQANSLIIPTEVGIQLTSTGWKLNWVDALTDEAVQNVASEAASVAINQAGINSYGMGFTLAANPLDGCVMDLNGGSTTGRVFWRFGVLVAVDEAARHALPTLPIADAQEQAAVTSILTRPSAT